MRLEQSHSEVIKRKAHALGFSHTGIANAESLAEEGSHLKEWLHRGFHAGMAWMARNTERRTDPAQIVPGAHSVIVSAYNYFTPRPHTTDRSMGKISRYAWGEDYHEIVTPKLRELQEFVDSLQEETISRCYVDTGPVMEKAWAVRAGIGWLGKHTNLITRDRGSWIFLGVIITTLKLEYDSPISDFCGSCTACIEACPTNAIVEPYVVDSNRCIPYITIECKDSELPATDTMDFDNWVFGCDVCQDVCPWNRFAVESHDAAFQPKDGITGIELHAVDTMSAEEFRRRFRKSPVKRTKLGGLKRNARIVRTQNESNNR